MSKGLLDALFGASAVGLVWFLVSPRSARLHYEHKLAVIGLWAVIAIWLITINVL